MRRWLIALGLAFQEMLANLTTNAPPRDREIEAARLRERSASRFSR